MKFGFHMSTRGATVAPDAIAAVARCCDELGYDYFGVNDHVVVCRTIESDYPYTPDGSWAGAAQGTCLDALATLAFIANATQRVRLLTSVLVLPHRAAVLTAKMLATVDVLSKGRLTLGAGVGWMREEMEALSAPDYARRGSASNEYIESMRLLWQTNDVVNYDGEFVQFRDVVFEPKPVQSAGPPIWIGGEGSAARKRAVAIGDGWYPVGLNPKVPLDTVARYASALAEVHELCEASGRDPNTLDTALFAPWVRLGKELRGDTGRRPLTGSAQAIGDDIQAYGDAGLETLVLNLESSELERTLDNCRAFAEVAKLTA
jgi:probable F420-dependent oxidoreductase